MADVARFYGFSPNRSGFICCPFHGEKTPSLKLYENGKGWCCFGCHKGGDVINFVELLFSLNFQQACQKINNDFQLNLSFDTPRMTPKQKKEWMKTQQTARHANDYKEIHERNRYNAELRVIETQRMMELCNAQNWDEIPEDLIERMKNLSNDMNLSERW